VRLIQRGKIYEGCRGGGESAEDIGLGLSDIPIKNPVPILRRNFVRNCADRILEYVSIDCFGSDFDRHFD